MKRKLKEMLAVALCAVGFSAFAAGSGMKDDPWKIGSPNEADVTAWKDDTGKKLTVAGTGKMMDWADPDDLPWANDNRSLTSIEICDGVTSIGHYAFFRLTGVTQVEIAGSVTDIGPAAFMGCSALTGLEIPEGVKNIDDDAFSDSGLMSVTISSTVTNIATRAFNYCSALKTVTFAEGSQLKSIGSYAFCCVSSLVELEIPASVTSIDGGAFVDATNVTVNAGNAAYGMVDGLLCDKRTMTVVSGIDGAEVTIPSSMTSIAESAFDCSLALCQVTISAGVTNIGDWAFECCENLTNVTFEAGSQLETIGEGAFGYYIPLLGEIEIPASVKSIGDEAFCDCEGLSNVTVRAITPPEFGTGVFTWCADDLTIYVPYGTGDAYRTADGWSAYADIIVELPEPPSAPEISAESEAFAFDVRDEIALTGEVTVEGVSYSDTAFGAAARSNVTLGYMNETTGATGTLATGLSGSGAADVNLPKKDGTYRLTHSTGGLTSFVKFTVSGYPVGSNPENPWTVGDGAIAWTDGRGNVYFKPPRCTVSRTGLETVTNAMGGASFPVWLVSADDTETNALVMAIGASGAQYKTLGEVQAADEDSCTLFDVEGCVVNYDGMGAAGEMKSDAFLPGVPTNLTAVGFRAFGWEFQGWTTNVAVGKILFADQAKIADPQAGDVYDLKAVWKFAPVKVGAKSSDNVTAYVDMNGTLHIDGTGAMKDFTAKNPAPWTDFAADFKAVEVAEGVTKIGNAAFEALDYATTETLTFQDDEHELNPLAFVSADGSVTNAPATAQFRVVKSGTSEKAEAFGPKDSLWFAPSIVDSLSYFGTTPVQVLTLADVVNRDKDYIDDIAGDKPYSRAMQKLLDEAFQVLGEAENLSDIATFEATYFDKIEALAEKDKTHEIEGADITWRVMDGMLFIEGEGKMPDFTEEPFTDGAPWNERKDDITNATVAAGITSVGDAAFAVCPAFAESSVLFKDPEAVLNLGAFVSGDGAVTNVPTVKVEIVTEDRRKLRVVPGGWTDADDPNATYESLEDALEDGVRAVVAAFTKATDEGEVIVPPAAVEEIVKTVTDEDGNEIELAAKYENVPSADGSAEGLVSEIENLPLIVDITGSNITVTVTATNKALVAGEVVKAMDEGMSNACVTAMGKLMPGVKVVGFTSSYLDMSAFWSFKVKKGQLVEFTKSIIAHIPMDVYDGMIYSVSRQHQGETEVLPDFADVEDSDTAEWVKVDTANQELVVKTRKFCEYALGSLEPETTCTVTVGNSGKLLGAADPSSLATNFQIRVTGRVNVFDFAGYCRRAKGEAADEYAVNFVCTKIPQSYAAPFKVIPGTFTITDSEDIMAKWAAEDLDAGYPTNGYVHVRLGCDPTMGKVKGEKVYKLKYDKKTGLGSVKVSISATAAKDYVFAGWYEDPGFATPATFFTGSGKNMKQKDYRETSQSITVTDNVYLFARFVKKSTTADPIAWLRYAGAGYCGADASVFSEEDEVWYQGVALPTNACQIAFGSLSLPTVTVSGLPSGVKFDKTTLRFTGAPTVASTDRKPFFTIKVTVKNKSGANDVLLKNVRVEPLPAWAIGNFDGYHIEEGATNGTFTATVGKTGKVSGKTKGGWADTTFSAKNFSEVFTKDGTNLVYAVDVDVKYKDPITRKTVTETDTLYLIEDVGTKLGVIGGGDADGCGAVAVQRAWDRKADASIGFNAFPAFDTKALKTPLTLDNGLTLKFGAKGKVTIGGTVNGIKASGSTYALATAWRSTSSSNLLVEVPVYVAPTRNHTGISAVYDVLLTVKDGKFAEAKFGMPPFSTYLMEGSDSRFTLVEYAVTETKISGRIAPRREYLAATKLPAEIVLAYRRAAAAETEEARVAVAADGTFSLLAEEFGENVRFVRDAAGAEEIAEDRDGRFTAVSSSYLMPIIVVVGLILLP